MSNINSILFICTGNSCRSVMAEGLLKKRLKELGKDRIKVSSAGIRGMDGMSPTNETIEVLKAEGVDMGDFKSRGITAELVRDSDLILVMEEMHRKEVLRLVPEAAARTYLLKEFGKPDSSDYEDWPGILDPIGKPMEFYKYCLGSIKKEIERIAKIL